MEMEVIRQPPLSIHPLKGFRKTVEQNEEKCANLLCKYVNSLQLSSLVINMRAGRP